MGTTYFCHLNCFSALSAFSFATALTAQISYAPELTDAQLTTRTIDVHKPVGVIGGSSAVSGSGSASYTIPIQLPPGTNGVVPHLAVTYDSRGGNGVLGKGWGLSGLSVISRTGKDYFHDQARSAVGFTAEDRFSLEGQRLMVTNSGTYGASGTEYDTEVAAFMKVTSIGQFGSGPGSFSVLTKEGATMDYGGTADSRMLSSDGQHVLAWRLNRVQDAFGNYITYQYEGDLTENRLQEIRYTGHVADPAVVPPNTVQFHYAERADVNLLFAGASTVNGVGTLKGERKLLDYISIWSGSELFKRYRFKYTQRDLGRSYLQEVEESGNDPHENLNSTIITYGDVHDLVQSHAQIVLPTDFTYPVDYSVGDFNGNGISDILVAPRYQCEVSFHSKFAVYFDGSTTPSQTTTLSVLQNCVEANVLQNYTEQSSSLGWMDVAQWYLVDLPEAVQVLPFLIANDAINWDAQGDPFTLGPVAFGFGSGVSRGDYDGDGREDVLDVQIPYDYIAQNFEFRALDIYRPGATSSSILFTSNPSSLPDPQYKYTHRPGQFLLSGDLTGDGRSDILGVFEAQYPIGGSITHKLFLWSAGAWSEVSYGTSGAYNFVRDADQWTIWDVDGDGKLEFVALNAANECSGSAQTCRVLRLGTGNALELVSVSDVFIQDCSTFENYPGDFNGDGRTDLLTKLWNGTWKIQLSNGLGYSALRSYGFTQEMPTGADIRIADFDGDGLSDIGCTKTQEGPDQFLIHYSRGYDGLAVNFQTSTITFDDGLQQIAVNDVNGDGRADLMVYSNQTAPRVYSLFADSHDRSIRKVANGIGHITEFDYGYLTQDDVAPYNETGPNDYGYPIGLTIPPLEVVKSVSVPNGIGQEHRTAYLYQQPVLEKKGRGFLGFGSTSSIDLVTGARSLSGSTFDPFRFIALPAERKSFLADTYWPYSTLEALSEQTIHAEPFGIAGGRFYVRTNSATTTNHLAADATAVTTNTEWNECGLVKASQSSIQGVSSAFTQTEFTDEGPSGLPCRPSSVTITTTRSGENTVSVKSCFSYESQTGALWDERSHCGDPIEMEVDHRRDAFGNVVQSRKRYAGLAVEDARIQRWTYDAQGRYVTEQETYYNDEGSPYYATETFGNRNLWGAPRYKVGADGLAVAWAYDGFGQTTVAKAPFVPGVVRYGSSFTREWDVQDGHYYFERSEDPAGPDVTVYYDLLGREVERCTEAFWGDWSCSATTYDERGNIATRSTPHLDGEDFAETTSTYDDYNRLVNAYSSLSEKNTSYSYDEANGQLTVTTTTETNGADQVRSKTVDASGMEVTATDDGGTLSKKYNSWGLLRQVAREGLQVLTNGYDDYGRKVSMTDLDAGTTEYQYDPFGQVTKEKEPRGFSTYYTYDNLGRVVLREGEEGQTNYQYYLENGLFKDMPVRIDGPTGSYRYTYGDDLLRLTSVTKRIYQDDFVTGYAYDEFDRVSKIIYPSGVEVNRAYATNGGLAEVTYNGHTLFNGTDANGLGQYTEYGLSDGCDMSITYDRGLPLHYYAHGGLGTAQDLSMTYDLATGNIRGRRDALMQRRETFTYDNLNRLTGASVYSEDEQGNTTGTVSTNSYTYDGAMGSTKGNLVEKSDIGLLGYGGQGSRVTGAYNSQFPTPPDVPPLVISQQRQDIGYTPFSKVSGITEKVNGQDMVLSYTYGPDLQRSRMRLLADGQEVLRRWYVGEYEKQVYEDGGTVTQEVHYIQGGDGLCAMIVVENGSAEIYTVYKDHLGSIVSVTQPYFNQVLWRANQSFDPWGRPRKPTTWDQGDLPDNPRWLFRGYTGHETLDPFGLINMNGRCYDPVIGRMLSADPVIASLSTTQAFNRYSYANSNPMMYTDPSGNVIGWAVPLIIGAIAGFEVGGWISSGTLDFTKWDSKDFDAAISGGIIGAGIGLGVSAGMGLSSAQTGFFAKFVPTNAGTSVAWDIASNALITGNVNMLSMLAQGGSSHDIAVSGMIGLGAGGLGGLSGRAVNGFGTQTAWGQNAIRTQAYVTNGLSGFGDRFYRTKVAGEGNPGLNGLGGMAEGLYAANLSFKWGASTIQHTKGITESVWGRYASAGVSGAITSVPRLSLTIGAWEVEKWFFNTYWNIVDMNPFPWWGSAAAFPLPFAWSLWPGVALYGPDYLHYPSPGRP